MLIRFTMSPFSGKKKSLSTSLVIYLQVNKEKAPPSGTISYCCPPEGETLDSHICFKLLLFPQAKGLRFRGNSTRRTQTDSKQHLLNQKLGIEKEH